MRLAYQAHLRWKHNMSPGRLIQVGQEGVSKFSRQRAYSVNFHPDALCQQPRFIFVHQGLLEWEEGSIVAVMVNPAADNVDLIDFRLPHDARRLSHRGGDGEQVVYPLFSGLRLMRNTALFNQPSMPDQK